MVDGEAVITFSEVTKGFGRIEALSPVSFGVAPGEFVSLIGPSGCGKSTLLRLASRLEAPTSGTISRKTERIGYVFQEPTLMPWRTVQHNVELLAELDGMDKTLRRARTQEVLQLVGLDEFADHHPTALSGGMKMRASLARSLLLEPELFLFDEPFGALDQMTRHRLNAELMTLFAERRFASLFVTHSVEEAVYLSTRVLVMSARPGRLVAQIEIPFPYPRDLALRYEPEFAATAGRIAATLIEAA